MLFKCLVKKNTEEPLSLKNFHNNRNKILIVRRTGGLGDILMHRMIFENFKTLMPEAEITFAVPWNYHSIVKDHPFIDHLIDPCEIKKENYGIIYDTTTRCRVHEAKMAPYCQDHRSDIWANSCGVILTKHNMHLKDKGCHPYTPVPKKSVLFIPGSSETPEKNLSVQQVKEVVKGIKQLGFNPITLHHSSQPIFDGLNVKEYVTHSLEVWLTTINDSDYVISVDTAAFHAAGGLGKPLVGIFTYTDGKVYGKYYNFILVQKHRDNGDWDCGPCFNHHKCPKTKIHGGLPCVTTIDSKDIMQAFEMLLKKKVSLPIAN